MLSIRKCVELQKEHYWPNTSNRQQNKIQFEYFAEHALYRDHCCGEEYARRISHPMLSIVLKASQAKNQHLHWFRVHPISMATQIYGSPCDRRGGEAPQSASTDVLIAKSSASWIGLGAYLGRRNHSPIRGDRGIPKHKQQQNIQQYPAGPMGFY